MNLLIAVSTLFLLTPQVGFSDSEPCSKLLKIQNERQENSPGFYRKSAGRGLAAEKESRVQIARDRSEFIKNQPRAHQVALVTALVKFVGGGYDMGPEADKSADQIRDLFEFKIKPSAIQGFPKGTPPSMLVAANVTDENLRGLSRYLLKSVAMSKDLSPSEMKAKGEEVFQFVMSLAKAGNFNFADLTTTCMEGDPLVKDIFKPSAKG
ncbi:MAG: hypothetical protein K2X47_15590 [Bdellovibrionales bacterium]|nr:hypothetical protein [Bdellovibrionales bacterium]